MTGRSIGCSFLVTLILWDGVRVEVWLVMQLPLPPLWETKFIYALYVVVLVENSILFYYILLYQ